MLSCYFLIQISIIKGILVTGGTTIKLVGDKSTNPSYSQAEHIAEVWLSAIKPEEYQTVITKVCLTKS